MLWAWRRLSWVILTLAVIVLPGRARADDPDLTILTPPVLPPLTSAAPALSAPPDVAAFENAIVLGVDVVVDPAADRVWPATGPLPTIGTLKAGDFLTAAAAREAMHEVLAYGGFADARVELEGGAGGVRVRVVVVPRKVIDGIRIDLHGAPVDTDEVLRDLDIATENELVATDLVVLEKRLELILQRHGFPAPRVAVTTRPTKDPLRVALEVRATAGPPRRIERRVFYTSNATKEEIAAAEKTYAPKVGTRADEALLATADTALEAFIRARHHHRAEVSHDVVLYRGIVVLRVRAAYGTRFETHYEGNDHFDASALDDALDLETETDRTPNHLVAKLTDYYVKHGFLDAEIKLEQRGTTKDPSNWLVFHVTEGARVQVSARSYPCLREDDVKRLKEGGPTSARAIGREIDSFLEEELPANDILSAPDPKLADLAISHAPGTPTGARPAPLDLEPKTAYVPETYERAVNHVQELYRSEGFLSAQVGPTQVIRRQCSPRSPPGECTPLPLPTAQSDVCGYDAIGLPQPVPTLAPGSSCVPDVAHGIACEARVLLRVPVKLGPRTQLWDVGFSGAYAIAPKELAKAANVPLGHYANTLELEEARKRVVDAYKEEGYTFADVKYSLEQSPDHTRARVRFSVTEGDQVRVGQIILRGNTHTDSALVRRRIALVEGQPYRASLLRKTEERIAILGPFSTVAVDLENPYIPQRTKNVIITMVERPRQYTELGPGFSTGDGFRLRGEYGNTNIAGNAIQLTLRLQLAYIPTPLIIDQTARENYRELGQFARLGVRATASVIFPEIGLGPLVRAGSDALLVHDLQRDFFLTKLALVPNVSYRPLSQIQLSFFQSFEFNNSRIFQSGGVADYLQSLIAQGQNVTDVARQLLVPDGETYAFAQRLLVTWDRRDNAFNASRGTYLVTGIEHVDAFPTEGNLANARARGRTAPPESHFVKMTQTFAGYIPLPRGIRIAALTRVGMNFQLTNESQTYPDRLFFMGGVDTMRGWTLNSFIPQDNVDRIYATQNLPDRITDPSNPGATIVNPNKFLPSTQPINGGNLMVNERVEVRIPIRGPFETVLFGDIGNLWIDPKYPFEKGAFPLRVAVGTGVRVQTPVGPLAVDYGFNVTKEPYEDLGAINFAIGLF